VFSGTLASTCPKCGMRFAVFFPAKDDLWNDEYLTRCYT
jgi:rRNA maturation protein Nop10